VTRFIFIDREKAHHDVTVLCRLLRVSRSGYYAWRSRPASPRAVADDVLTAQIQTAFEDNRRLYGAPRIHAELLEAGVRVGRKRVARLMRAAEIVGCHRRKRSFSITRQNPNADVAPDRVDRKFVATEPNQLWVADVTYVPTVQGRLYLACVTDWGHPLWGIQPHGHRLVHGQPPQDRPRRRRGHHGRPPSRRSRARRHPPQRPGR